MSSGTESARYTEKCIPLDWIAYVSFCELTNTLIVTFSGAQTFCILQGGNILMGDLFILYAHNIF